MKKAILTLIVLAISLTAMAQATQPCIVKQYNQKQQKTPLSGVQVEVRGAQTATSAANGSVTLQFATLKPGDRVPFRAATKAGFELMNKTAVEQWNISRDQKPFEIVLIQSVYFTQLKGKLKQSSVDSYHEKYEKALAELERLQKEGKLKEEEYRQKLDELEDHYDNQLKNLDAYVDQFARIDLSELSEQEQHFVELAHVGRLDEAAEAYNALNAAGKYITAVENVRRLNEDIAKLEDEKAQQQEAAKTFFAILQRQVNTLKLAGGEENYRKAGELLKRAALADTTNLDVVAEYAVFAQNQHDFKDAERFYHMGIHDDVDVGTMLVFSQGLANTYLQMHQYKSAEEILLVVLESFQQIQQEQQDILPFMFCLAQTQNDLGVLYYETSDYAKAEDYLIQALARFTKLSEQDHSFIRNLSATQVNLGNLYYVLNELPKAELYHLEALKNKTILFQQDPDAYRDELAIGQHNLGLLYQKSRNYLKAVEYETSAMDNYTLLFAHNPEAYRSYLAGLQINLGILYQDLHDYPKAEDHLKKALENYEVLYRQDEDVYLVDLADVNNSLGNLYYNTVNLSEAERFFLLALKYYSQLFSQNEDVYRARLAMCQYNLGNIYKMIRNYSQSEQFYLQSIENYLILYNQSRNANLQNLVHSMTGIAGLYFICQNYKKSEEYYLHAYELINDMPEHTSDVFRLEMAIVCDDLGVLYCGTQDFIKAEKYYLKSEEHYTTLVKQYPEVYQERMANLQNNLGQLYQVTQNYSKAEQYFLSALKIRSQLFNQYPDSYRYDYAKTQSAIGYLLVLKQDFTQAEKYLLDAENNFVNLYNQNVEIIGKERAFIFNVLSYLYSYKSNFAKALDYINKAIDLQPEDVAAYDTKGEILLMKGDEQGALEMWKKVIELNPKFVEQMGENSNLYKQLKAKGLIND